MRDLSALEWSTVARAWFLLIVAAVALRCLSPRNLLARVSRQPHRAKSRPPAIAPERVAALVEVSSACVPRSTCLTKAVVVYYLLNRQGHDAELMIGVRRREEGLEAHAWVGCAEQVVMGADGHEQFAPILRVRGASIMPVGTAT